MLGHKPKAVMRQVLRAGGAPREQLARAEVSHCDKCDEAVLPLRLYPMKAPARYTFNHEVLIEVLIDAGNSRRAVFLPLDRMQLTDAPSLLGKLADAPSLQRGTQRLPVAGQTQRWPVAAGRTQR